MAGCRRCNRCCTSFGVCITIFDAMRLARGSGRKMAEFVSLVDDYGPRQRAEPAILIGGKPVILVLRHDKERRCAFFNGSGCSAYASRPYLCRTYPFVLEGGGLADAVNRACPSAWTPSGRERERYLEDLEDYYGQVKAYGKIAEEWNAHGGGTLARFLEFAAQRANGFKE